MDRSRRALLAGLGASLTASALGGCGVSATPERRRLRRIGWLTFREPADISLHQTLPQLGWIEGRDFVIDVRHPDGVHDRLPELAAELVNLPVDILITSTLNPTLAAKQATQTTPIVFVSVGDPVEAGIVSSLSKPGGNITGVGGGSNEIAAKRLETLKEAVPAVQRVTVLTNTLAPDQAIALRVMQEASDSVGLEIQSVRLNFIDELDAALIAALPQRPDSLMSLHAPSFFGPGISPAVFAKLLNFAVSHQLPQMFGGVEFARAGGLMAMSTDANESRRLLARVVDRILRGANPGDVPVAMNSEFVFGVNLAMARKLELTLHRATEVIQ